MYISKEVRLNLDLTKYGIKEVKELIRDSHKEISNLSYGAKHLVSLDRNKGNYYKLVDISFDRSIMNLYIHYVTSDEEPDIDDCLDHLLDYLSDIALPDNDHFIGTLKQCYDSIDISEKVNNLIFDNGNIKLSNISEKY